MDLYKLLQRYPDNDYARKRYRKKHKVRARRESRARLKAKGIEYGCSVRCVGCGLRYDDCVCDYLRIVG